MLLKKVTENAVIPFYGSEGSSGLDLVAVHDAILEEGIPVLVSTGLQVAFIDEGIELQIRPRSGNSLKKGFTVTNSPGTIDNDYRGVIGVILHSLKGRVLIKAGDRIAQMVPCKVQRIFISMGEVIETERGSNGFGSTEGKNSSIQQIPL